MAADDIGCKQLQQLRQENKRLARMYFAGVSPEEFSKMSRMQEVEMMSVSSLCDEVQRCIAVSKNKKDKRSIAFSELCYIMAGILLVYKAQVTLLYDQVLRQAYFTLEFAKSTQSITMWQKPTMASFSKKHRSRKDDSIESVPKKRVKLSEVAEFNWQSLDSIEVDDDDSIIQILKTSKTMNRDQISIREVLSEPIQDPLSQCSEFAAAVNGNTENFLEIRELIAKGHSITHIIHSEAFTPMVTGDNGLCEEDDCDDYAPNRSSQRWSTPIPVHQRSAPVSSPQWSTPLSSPRRSTPLPDIDGCLDESEQNSSHHAEHAGGDDIDMVVVNNEAEPATASSQLSSKKPSTTERKGKRRFMDDVLQIPVICDNRNTEKKLLRCLDPKSDCITKTQIMRHFKWKYFEQSAHALKALQPRYAKQTVSMLMDGIHRVKRTKPKEANDLQMVQNFLNAIDDEPENDVQVEEPTLHEHHDQSLEEESLEEFSVDQSLSLPTSESDDELMDFNHQVDPMYDSDRDMSTMEPESFNESEPHDELEPISRPEQDLPNVNQSPIIEQCKRSTNVPTQNCRLASATIPRNVLRLLNQFVTVDTANDPSKSSSEELFVLNNQKNRESWGLKGVLANLFRLWHSDTHPVSMKELMHQHKQKVAAALAFYSVLELNSPRIGLIVIEKCEDSNAVYNIAMSPKLVSLLQKRNAN